MTDFLDGDGLRGGLLRWLVWGGALALLAAPWVAMQLDAGGVHWTALDFAVMGTLLAMVGLAFELTVRLARDNAYMLGSAIAVGAAFLTVWANLAVGIVGSEHNPVNLGFFVVLALGLAAALVARLRPRGLAAAMRFTAAAQLALALWLWLAGHGQAWVFTGVMCLAWLASAALFARARDRGDASRAG